MNIRTAQISIVAATVFSAMFATAALASNAGAAALGGPPGGPGGISAGDSAPWVSCFYGGSGEGAETCHFGDKDRVKRVEWHSLKNVVGVRNFDATKTEVSFKTGLSGATDCVTYAVITDANGNKRTAYPHIEG